ncbi:IS3 family transposase [Piscirickettsia salmonis]|uniref:IS3 family transposase n=1 Tax=Piscirickettsia salmonis TaxID=1238 RepID=UPI0012B88DFD|nr:IS3 family transposase [Piscirickettsia salmonis]
MCKIPTEVATLTKELKAGVTEYIEFYNNKRFHQTLDYKKPMDVYCNLQPQLFLEAA